MEKQKKSLDVIIEGMSKSSLIGWLKFCHPQSVDNSNVISAIRKELRKRNEELIQIN